MKRHIYVYSPTSAVRDKAAFRRGLARLRALGHEVEVDPAALERHQRFAGDDATRIDAIHRAAASGADVALISRGGYGLTRLLPDIRYKLLAKSIERGTRFVGLSDFTALQMAVLAKTGAVTWAGPALGEDFGAVEGTDEVMQACFDDMLLGQAEGAGWRVPKSDSAPALADGTNANGLTIGNAVLWGGNLCVLSSLVGTPWMPDIRGGVLFLEDVHEHPYRIERMLTQLLHAGILARQKAIVLGQFTQFRLVPHDRGFRLSTAIDWLREKTRTPVLTQLPFGHVPTKVLLPVGAKVSLIRDQREAFLLWPHGH